MDSEVTHKEANSLKEYFKRWPAFYYFVVDYFSPVYFGGLGPVAFLKKYPQEGSCLNLGSGARRLAPGVINVDLTNYDAVDVVADITHLPYADSSVAGIMCDQVLEHIPEPEKVMQEIRRVLIPGGYAYISTPFMYPFHASPSDYQRWTQMGYWHLFSGFEIVESGVRSGPFSTLCVFLCYFFAALFSFGHKRGYWFFVYALTFIFFPIKYLDILGNHLPFAGNMAAALYCVIKKT